MKAPLSDNQAERLAALKGCKIVDASAEPAFNEITWLAAYVCDVPITLIALVDANRFWWKSKVGWDGTQTPPDFAFCAYTILQSDIFIVPNALEDERFVSDPLVISDPHIRFYAGVPLITPEGYPLGVLCVIDRVARELTPKQVEALHSLGHQVTKLLELQRNLSEQPPPALEGKQVQKKPQQFFKGIIAGLGLASAILTTVGLVAYQSLTSFKQAADWQVEQYQVLNEIEDIHVESEQAMSAQNNYLRTGQARYLQPYYDATEVINLEIAQLRQTLGNKSTQQDRVTALETLISKEFAYIQQTILLRKNKGFAVALQPDLVEQGNDLMEQIDILIHQIKSGQNTELTKRSLLSESLAQKTIFTFSSGVLLNFLILAGVYYFIHREITERKRTEEILKQERDFTSAVINTVDALVMVLDTQGRIVRFNRACEQTTGYLFEEVRGKYFWDLFLIAEEIEPVTTAFKQLQASDFPNQYEKYWTTKDGARRLIAWSNTALLDEQGHLNHIISTGIDITERKRAEAGLWDSEERYRSVIESIGEGIVLQHADSSIWACNTTAEKILGLSTEQMIGRTSLDPNWIAIHEDGSPFPGETHPAIVTLRTGNPQSNVIMGIHKPDGTLSWISISTKPLFREGETTPHAVVTSFFDITERKLTEQIIKQERDFTSAVLETVGALVVVLDNQGRIVRFNRACEQITGYLFEEVIDKYFWDFFLVPEELEPVKTTFKQLQTGQLPNQYENYWKTKDGDRRLIVWSNTALLDEEGNVKHIISTGIDITERKRSEEELCATATRLAALIENLQAGILVEDESRRIVLVNQEFCKMFGISESPNTLIGSDCSKLAVQYQEVFAEPQIFIKQIEQILNEQNIVSNEEVLLADGRILERDYIPISIEENYRGNLWQYRDINARKEAEKALQQQIVAIETAMDGIAILNVDGQFIYLNEAHVELFGYSRDDLIGKNWQELYDENEIARFDRDIFPILRKNGRWRGKAIAKKKDGSTFAEEVSLTVISGMGLICVCRDITDRVKGEEALKQANAQLKSWVSELEERNGEITLLGQMSEVLQACLTVEEAYAAIPTLIQPLFPHLCGAIFLLSPSKNLVEAVTSWGCALDYSQKLFTPDECWALRRCRTHLVANHEHGLHCKHVQLNGELGESPLPAESICIPMMAQGEALGIVYLSANHGQRIPESKQHLAATVAEHIALALANLKLRETLQNQSIRDPLTGLFNRRYMEESLEREIQRATRKQQPLSIIMLDVDHFKCFNDTYGHEAGDLVLRELGLFLQANIRGGDIPCRYGGEELTLILPEASLEDAYKRAEQIREGAKQLRVQYRRQPLGAIALSCGVACFPQHGSSGEAAIRSADAALYRAKAEGRDRVIAAS